MSGSMDTYHATGGRRHYSQPLADATGAVNNYQPTSSPQYRSPQSQNSPQIPHHESLKPGGNLQNIHNPTSPVSSPKNKRLSALAGDEPRNSNRDSQISTTSTNASDRGKRKTHIGPWQLGKTLGKGSAGRVRSARHRITGQSAAVKIVSKKAAALSQSKSVAGMDQMLAQVGSGANAGKMIPYGIEREVVIMKLIEHPNIIDLYDVWQNRGELYLVLEYVEGGELFDYIGKQGYLAEKEAVRIFRQIISGLSYCHRFKICHRDLKPENILLDGNQNIKIVDFGMAALQPVNKYLKTSCGSPHYAAPEIAQGKPYRGDRVDIWSCGVILFAMLAGYLPFGTTKDLTVEQVLQEVIEGELYFPEDIGPEAQDLIWRMLQRNAKKRIPLDQMWEHPLLQKYQAYADNPRHSAKWIGGPPPPLTALDCGPPMRNPEDIDEVVFGNLCTLFQQVKKEDLVESLLTESANYEKVFYHALCKYREEQLENYEGPLMGISASDYHHGTRPTIRHSSTRASFQRVDQRRRSQYSIMSESVGSAHHHRRRQPSIAKTDESYDPFRSSRPQIPNPHADHALVTVLRGTSEASSRAQASSRATSARIPALARVRGQAAYSVPASSLPPQSSSLNQVHILRREQRERTASRSSLGSSYCQRPSPSGIRSSLSYKRGVSFDHTRNRLTSDQMKSSRIQPAPSPPTLQQRYKLDRREQSEPSLPPPTLVESPRSDCSPMIRSRKEANKQNHVQEAFREPKDPRKTKTTSVYVKEEARKVSTELSKYIDEAFNRSSIASSVASVKSRREDPKHEYQAALTSDRKNASRSAVGTSSDTLSRQAEKQSYSQRPLPKLPGSRLKASNSQEELVKTRENLKRQAAHAGLPPGSLDTVIAHLDRLMQPSTTRTHQDEHDRRIASAPDPYTLSPVREESGRDSWLTSSSPTKTYRSNSRTVSEPWARSPVKRGHSRGKARTSPDDNLLDWALVPALEIHKKSQQPPESSDQMPRARKSQENIPRSTDFTEKSVSQFTLSDDTADNNSRHAAAEERRSAAYDYLDASLEPIEEDDDDKENYKPRTSKALSREGRKKGWFRRNQSAPLSQISDRPPTPPEKDARLAQHVETKKEGRQINRTSDIPSETSQHSEPKKERAGAKELFFKFFSRKNAESSRTSRELALAKIDLDSSSSIAPSSNTSYTHVSGAFHNSSLRSFSDSRRVRTDRARNTVPLNRPSQPAPQNWFARFLHIKPASKILCFQVSRVRARKEVASQFREWRHFGMKDIVVDRVRNRIWAAVGERNKLSIKPVNLAVEFFTVLSYGRKTNLAVARFTQEKGAKSSFERIVGALEGGLREKSILVTEKKRWRDMEATLNGS